MSWRSSRPGVESGGIAPCGAAGRGDSVYDTGNSWQAPPAATPGGRRRGTGLAEELIGKYGYVGIALILILGGLGLPIPEEAPIILAAILTRNGRCPPSGPRELPGRVCSWATSSSICSASSTARRSGLLPHPAVADAAAQAQIKGYFHRHGFKILVSGRFVPGFRTAAYLTAGILKLPALKLLCTDLVAATLSTLMFGLGLLFADQIQNGIHEVQQWITLVVAVGLGSWLLYRYLPGVRSAPGLPVGPPVLEVDEVPLPLTGMTRTGPIRPASSSSRGSLAIRSGRSRADGEDAAAVDPARPAARDGRRSPRADLRSGQRPPGPGDRVAVALGPPADARPRRPVSASGRSVPEKSGRQFRIQVG